MPGRLQAARIRSVCILPKAAIRWLATGCTAPHSLLPWLVILSLACERSLCPTWTLSPNAVSRFKLRPKNLFTSSDSTCRKGLGLTFRAEAEVWLALNKKFQVLGWFYTLADMLR